MLDSRRLFTSEIVERWYEDWRIVPRGVIYSGVTRYPEIISRKVLHDGVD